MWQPTDLRRRLASVCLAVVSTAFVFSAYLPVTQAQVPAPQAGDNRLYLSIVAKAAGIVDPSPAPGATAQSLNAYLTWQFIDATLPDPRFTVLFEAWDDSPDVVVAEYQTAWSLAPGTLAMDTPYYWQVIVAGSNGFHAAGPIWRFRTEPWLTLPAAGTMVPVPAGEFLMGCDAGNTGYSFICSGKDTPLHRVWLDAYAIDKFEVTNGEYLACVQAGICNMPRKFRSHERENYFANPAFGLFPVLFVSRQDGIDFCAWAGKRLPTEAEWEKAARGSVDTRPFPWGNQYPDCTRENRPTEQSCPDFPQDTARVGSYPRGASPYGVHDLSANVFSWVFDKYDEGWYWSSPYENPVNTRDGRDFYVIRGGSYRDRIAYTRVSHRHFGHHGDTVGGDAPNYRSDRVGFRCAKSLP